MLRIFSHHL